MSIRFIETWDAIEDLPVDSIEGTIELEQGEAILKVLPLVRLLGVGVGTLVLTQQRLLLVLNDEKTTALELCRLLAVVAVEKFQFKVVIPPGVPALRIITPVDRAGLSAAVAVGAGDGTDVTDDRATSVQRTSSTSSEAGRRPSRRSREGDVPTMEQRLLFWSERDSWYAYLNEMVQAHKDVGGADAVLRAVKNIDLAELVSKVSMRHQGAEMFDSKENRASPPTIRRKSVYHSTPDIGSLLTFSRRSEQLMPILESAGGRGGFRMVKQIRISPQMVPQATVESMLHIDSPGQDFYGTLWCGLGCGELQVLEMPAGRCDSRIQIHADRVTALISVRTTSFSHVWTGSFDATISVIDAQSRRTIAALEQLDDAISVLTLVEHGDDIAVWSGTLSGTLIEWDARTHARRRTISIPKFGGRVQAVTGCAVSDRSLWCATGSCIVIVDLETGALARRTLTKSEPRTPERISLSATQVGITQALCDDVEPKLLDQPPATPTNTPSMTTFLTEHSPVHRIPEDSEVLVIQTSAASCVVAGAPGEMWTCSNITGILNVWDVRTYEPVQCGGRWRIDCGGWNSLCRSRSTIWGAANNGSLYLWDQISHNLLRELRQHSDAVRSVCMIGTHNIASGSGSREGSVLLWDTNSET